MVKHYRQIPIELDAVQWTGDNFEEIKEFLDGGAHFYSGCLFVMTANGEATANKTDYITKSGTEHFPIVKIVSAEIFEKVYVEAN